MINHTIQMILLFLEVNLIIQNTCPNSNVSDNITMHAFTHFDNFIEEMVSNIKHVCVLLDFLAGQPIVYTCILSLSSF